MSDVARYNPTNRFTGLAGRYAQFRPTYPDLALDFVVSYCRLGPDSLIVDVGSGTGISTRQFASRHIRVIGIEPNADMRAKAENENMPSEWTRPTYQEGRAEATGLPAKSTDAVVVAQAFHWFEAEAALLEFHRILKPQGWVALIWNERDERDPCTAAYGSVIRSGPGASILEAKRGQAGYALLSSFLFEQTQRVVFTHKQELDAEGLIGRAFSASYAPREPVLVKDFEERLQACFAQYQRGGNVALHYETAVFVGCRKDLPNAGQLI
jgi:ubiquinone/menaquinone biosynthesis C-methylase UbiE